MLVEFAAAPVAANAAMKIKLDLEVTKAGEGEGAWTVRGHGTGDDGDGVWPRLGELPVGSEQMKLKMKRVKKTKERVQFMKNKHEELHHVSATKLNEMRARGEFGDQGRHARLGELPVGSEQMKVKMKL